MLINIFNAVGQWSKVHMEDKNIIQEMKTIHFGSVCPIYCPFGNVLDEHGCSICRCNQGKFYPKVCG
jgi:hypothetical protein